MAQRATLLVDPDGIIRFVSVNDMSVGRNPEEVLRVLDALQTDELCPCNWKRASPSSRHNIAMRNLESLIESIPSYGEDIKLNLWPVLRQAELTQQQLWGTVVSTAHACGNRAIIEALGFEAQKQLSPQAFEAARTAFALMGMNNVYYRYTHSTAHEPYSSMPARLRMQGICAHGVEVVDFELWCAAVSAINGCSVCMSAHDRTLREKGVSEEAILAAIRIASVIHAASMIMTAEAALVSEALSAHSRRGSNCSICLACLV